MKKKYLQALDGLERWLIKESVISEELNQSLIRIRQAVSSVQEDDESDAGQGVLPPPAEISDDPQFLALYSDGGCRGNPGPGAFSFVIQSYKGEVLAEGSEFHSFTTNNKMELSGPIKGLNDLLNILPEKGRDPLLSKVKVITDSKYVVDGMKSWVKGWKSRGWKKADGKPPENLELWQELDKLRENFLNLEWQWVKGHGGHPQNEYCDRKANELMDKNIS